MSTIGQIMMAAAESMSLWRDLAIAGLAAIVIGCLWLVATLAGVE